jgi:hypothetical protein
VNAVVLVLWIAGGELDLDDTAVVGIVDDASGGTCTGTLIAPDLVLTAQHCVAPIVGPFDCATVVFGPAGDPSSFHVTTLPNLFSFDPDDYHPVAEIRIPPGGDAVCGRDVALLVLAAPITAAEAAPIEPRLDAEVTPGEIYAAVGYGAIDDNNTGAGERRRRDGLLAACIGDACGSSFVDAGEWVGEAGVCQGDSGGPALDADGRVIGVASRGSVGCVDPVYGSLAAHAAWLADQLPEPEPGADAGPDPAPDAGTPSDDDAAAAGCCDSAGSAGTGWLGGLLLLVALRRRHLRG